MEISPFFIINDDKMIFFQNAHILKKKMKTFEKFSANCQLIFSRFATFFFVWTSPTAPHHTAVAIYPSPIPDFLLFQWETDSQENDCNLSTCSAVANLDKKNCKSARETNNSKPFSQVRISCLNYLRLDLGLLSRMELMESSLMGRIKVMP